MIEQAPPAAICPKRRARRTLKRAETRIRVAWLVQQLEERGERRIARVEAGRPGLEGPQELLKEGETVCYCGWRTQAGEGEIDLEIGSAQVRISICAELGCGTERVPIMTTSGPPATCMANAFIGCPA